MTNKRIVPVPDKRLNELAKIVNPDKIQHSTIDFVDIAGLVRGASKGEGLEINFYQTLEKLKLSYTWLDVLKMEISKTR